MQLFVLPTLLSGASAFLVNSILPVPSPRFFYGRSIIRPVRPVPFTRLLYSPTLIDTQIVTYSPSWVPQPIIATNVPYIRTFPKTLCGSFSYFSDCYSRFSYLSAQSAINLYYINQTLNLPLEVMETMFIKNFVWGGNIAKWEYWIGSVNNAISLYGPSPVCSQLISYYNFNFQRAIPVPIVASSFYNTALVDHKPVLAFRGV